MHAFSTDSDGLLCRSNDRKSGEAILKDLRAKGFKYHRNVLWSKNWDREMGYWEGDQFLFNPSMIAYFNQERIEHD